jgi:hypothetical protein
MDLRFSSLIVITVVFFSYANICEGVAYTKLLSLPTVSFTFLSFILAYLASFDAE